MRIDDDEIRFWVRKVEPVKTLNTNIENDLFSEIPMFLKYLSQLNPIDFSRSRMVFTPEEIKTESLLSVVKESKSWLHKDLEIIFNDLFYNIIKESHFFATAKVIKERYYEKNSQVTINYIHKVLLEEMKMEKMPLGRYYLFDEKLTKTVGSPFKIKNTNNQEIKDYTIEEDPFA